MTSVSNSHFISYHEMKFELGPLRTALKECDLPQQERQLARGMADSIIEVANATIWEYDSNPPYPGILHLQLSKTMNIEPKDRSWCSDFQDMNPKCPERIHLALRKLHESKKHAQKNQKKRKGKKRRK